MNCPFEARESKAQLHRSGNLEQVCESNPNTTVIEVLEKKMGKDKSKDCGAKKRVGTEQKYIGMKN